MTRPASSGDTFSVPYATPSALAARSQRADVEFERGGDGIWRYAGTDVEIPGARDVTLEERIGARHVVRPGEEPEAIMLSLSEIIADSRLNWVLQAGTRLSGGKDDVFVVPWAVWTEQAGEVVDVSAPERDADGVMRGVARVEREVRLARHRLEVATAERARTLLFAARLGVTRRATAKVLGLSPSRVQQLLDEATDATRGEADELAEDARTLLAALEESAGGSEQQVAAALDGPAARVERAMHVLRLCDLVRDVDGRAELTPSGAAALTALRTEDHEADRA